ncbi:hypothetical protein [Afifella sp. YEN Y35]|uniref:hypothetical protein n=1 Tax=Afifella sp. YEN Y35 TaxID=3388337 RepID=UPI0039E1E4C3
MSRRAVAVTQSEITRALKGVAAAGLPVERVEIDPRTGRIVVTSTLADGSTVRTGEGARNDWDTVLNED